jgi:hypothetical protein
MTSEVPTKPPAVVTLDSGIGVNTSILRWYHDTYQARYGQWVLMADRRGVVARGYLHLIPPSWILDAGMAFGALEADLYHTAAALATHTRTPGTGELKEINRAT